MLNELQKSVIENALDKWGSMSELVVTIEELSELQKEVTKQIRNEGKMENLVEEMADVYIVMEYLKMIFTITDDDINREVEKKLNRRENRLNTENEQQKGEK